MGGLAGVALGSFLLVACASSAPAERIDPAELRATPPADEGAEGATEADPQPAAPPRDLLAGCREPGDPPPPERLPEPGHRVTEAIQAHAADFRTCYEGLLARDATVQGCVLVRFTVVPDGAVKEIEAVRSTIDHEDFTLCVTGVFTRVHVDAWSEPDPVRFAFPFVFSPEP